MNAHDLTEEVAWASRLAAKVEHLQRVLLERGEFEAALEVAMVKERHRERARKAQRALWSEAA